MMKALNYKKRTLAISDLISEIDGVLYHLSFNGWLEVLKFCLSILPQVCFDL